jgi:hypothetical protein
VRTRIFCLCLLTLFVGVTAQAQTAGKDVVVLKGGEVIVLKEPYTVKGSNAILIRSDGTMLSVPVSEIDRKATAARKAAPSPPASSASVTTPAETPAEAVRANRERPKARVRLTDADVGHQSAPESEGSDGTTAAGSASGLTPAKIEVADYTQDRAGNQFVVRGSVRNVGSTTASSVRMSVYLVNEKGESFVKRDAGLETTTIEAGHSISFSAAFDTGGQNVALVRFQPFWVGAPLPSGAPAPGNSPGGAASNGSTASNGSAAMRNGSSPAAAAAAPPPPVPTPYGRGLLYAPSAPPVSDQPPADGKNGYLPGAARPEDQPKPPE